MKESDDFLSMPLASVSRDLKRLSDDHQFPRCLFAAVGFHQIEINPGTDFVAGIVGEVPGDRGAGGGKRFHPMTGNGEDLDGSIDGEIIKGHFLRIAPVTAPGIGIFPDPGEISRHQGRIGLGHRGRTAAAVERLDRDQIRTQDERLRGEIRLPALGGKTGGAGSLTKGAQALGPRPEILTLRTRYLGCKRPIEMINRIGPTVAGCDLRINR